LIFTGSQLVGGLATAGTKLVNFFTGGGPVSLIKDTVKDLSPVLPQLERLGPSLNSFATGLLAFGKGLGSIDSGKIKDLSGMLKTVASGDTFGAGLGKLTPVLTGVEKIGPALNNYAAGIVAYGRAINTIDIAKAEKLKEVMKGPGLFESISAAAGKMVTATANLVTNKPGDAEKSESTTIALNNTMRELALLLKQISTNTKETVDATKALSGNVW
jgi:hypothetical protein